MWTGEAKHSRRRWDRWSGTAPIAIARFANTDAAHGTLHRGSNAPVCRPAWEPVGIRVSFEEGSSLLAELAGVAVRAKLVERYAESMGRAAAVDENKSNAIQGAKECQQVEPCRFQTRAEIRRNLHRDAAGRPPSLAQWRDGGQCGGMARSSGGETMRSRSSSAQLSSSNSKRNANSSGFRLGGNERGRPACARSRRRHCRCHNPSADTRHSACVRHCRCSSG